MENGICTKNTAGDREYRAEIPVTRRDSWKDLSYYLYFHSRITPGILVRYEAPVPNEKRELWQKSLRCSYTLRKGEKSVEGDLEGVRPFEDGSGFWCFDYLGTMLLKLVRSMNAEEDPPDPDFFPLELEIHYEAKQGTPGGSLNGRLGLKWE